MYLSLFNYCFSDSFVCSLSYTHFRFRIIFCSDAFNLSWGFNLRVSCSLISFVLLGPILTLSLILVPNVLDSIVLVLEQQNKKRENNDGDKIDKKREW